MPKPDAETLLTVENLKVFFRGEETVARAVDGVSYRVGRRETVCLVGESGCGKTVSALAVLGLVPVPPGEIAGGRIRFDGQNLLELDDEQMQRLRGRHIAMVFQEPLTSLNPVFKIGDQIAEAIAVHREYPPEELKRQIIALLHDVGISSPEQRANAYPHQLSGGQRQRVMIAMALACDPQLVIADEPTTALDVTVQAQILRLLKRLQQQRAMSVLYITHDLGVVASIADYIYVMYAGIIVEQGRPEHIFYAAHHPYTQGLLAALPTRRKKGTQLYSIPGSVPDPAYKPDGCPFHPRCPHVEPSCRSQSPAMCDYGKGHRARCPVLYARPKTVDLEPNT